MFQHISRYQDAVPTNRFMEVEGQTLTKDNVQKLMEDFFDDDTDFTSGDNISKSKGCWCIWGEEEDVIITVL